MPQEIRVGSTVALKNERVVGFGYRLPKGMPGVVKAIRLAYACVEFVFPLGEKLSDVRIRLEDLELVPE
ncbi:MAG: hypothetical protein HYT22_03195 [Candidatus Niyogibacteria bacterium]|nr:hypothetical protein [Candidatus Niyogibacteria bacterium]